MCLHSSTAEFSTLSLHDALPIFRLGRPSVPREERGIDVRSRSRRRPPALAGHERRSEEQTSELQSPCKLVCRLLLEEKKHDRRVRGADVAGGVQMEVQRAVE